MTSVSWRTILIQLKSKNITNPKTEDGFIYAVKTQKLIDEADAEMIANKKEEMKIRRAERSKSKKLAKAAAKAQE